MRFEATAEVTHPARAVFGAMRDHTPQLVYLMPNVESVTVLQREERPPVVHLHCRWQGARTELPWLIRLSTWTRAARRSSRLRRSRSGASAGRRTE